jgi:hypothetical protein
VLLGLSLLGTPAVAQQEIALETVERAVAAGDADALLGEASDRVEIALFGSSTLYSRAQALYVMQQFFQDHPPVQFSLQHTSVADGNWFASGPYFYTHSDRPLRVYVRLRAKGEGAWEVREIRIEERLRE